VQHFDTAHDNVLLGLQGNKWLLQLPRPRPGERQIYIGSFDTKEEAIKRRDLELK
jgi:hypothetical protein